MLLTMVPTSKSIFSKSSFSKELNRPFCKAHMSFRADIYIGNIPTVFKTVFFAPKTRINKFNPFIILN